MCPFDPFFSSANKRHYIPREGVNEEYKRIMALPFEERIKIGRAIKEKHSRKEATKEEITILHKMGFIFRIARKHKIHVKDEKAHSRNRERWEKDKKKGRVVVVLPGYNTCHK